MHVKDWLVRKFGGWTVDDVNKLKASYTLESSDLETQLHAWRDRALIAETKLADKQSEIENQKEQVLALTHAISNEGREKDKHFDPIATIPLSWPRARREFEKKDREVQRKENEKLPA